MERVTHREENPLYTGCLYYGCDSIPFREFVRSDTLRSFRNRKCGRIVTI